MTVTYTGTAERNGRFWVIEVPEIEGYAQARLLTEVGLLARGVRNQIIYRAVKEGMTIYKVAKATGLTQAAVSEIQTRKC